MKTTNQNDVLTERITYLKSRQAHELQLLKQQYDITLNNLKPINLIKSTFQEFKSSKELKSNLINGAVGIGTNFLLSKVMFLSPKNPLKNILYNGIRYVANNFTRKNQKTLPQ
ncbi:hypothetical protein [Flavobacterium sp.]|uniref:hypothetical protein n=1 Tax=Flavobacterium sp. TaxID=239 RepID=UPI00286C8E5B|nr:hypothetical protein [Flavobacterium sp.]